MRATAPRSGHIPLCPVESWSEGRASYAHSDPPVRWAASFPTAIGCSASARWRVDYLRVQPPDEDRVGGRSYAAPSRMLMKYSFIEYRVG